MTLSARVILIRITYGYELHRVWVVEATLKEGTRHINPRRTFYLDEDTYQIALIDHYDQRGDMWRLSEAHSINYYEVPTYWSTIEVHMDLQAGRYVANGVDNQEPVNTFDQEMSPNDFTPQALRTRGSTVARSRPVSLRCCSLAPHSPA